MASGIDGSKVLEGLAAFGVFVGGLFGGVAVVRKWLGMGGASKALQQDRRKEHRRDVDGVRMETFRAELGALKEDVHEVRAAMEAARLERRAVEQRLFERLDEMGCDLAFMKGQMSR